LFDFRLARPTPKGRRLVGDERLELPTSSV
jgi:hypothetical protein